MRYLQAKEERLEVGESEGGGRDLLCSVSSPKETMRVVAERVHHWK
jgi:hypothetical protein